MEKISFVIPCYGSEKSIDSVINEIKETMSLQKLKFEVILVNDQSPDNVWDVIKKNVEKDSNIVGINLSRNFGQHSALMAGYSHASGDVIVSIDDDGQTPVSEVTGMLAKLEEGYDVVFAEYDEIKQKSFRVFGSFLNEKMSEYLVNKPKEIKQNSYFVARKFIIDEMLRYQGSYPYISGLIFRATKNVANVKVHHRDRLYGQSGYRLATLIKMWVNGFTAFSVKPLRIATMMGFLCALCGIAYGCFTIIYRLMAPEVVMGYSSIMAALLFMGGMIMIMLGLIGEYVGRIYMCINNAPQFVIREVIQNECQENVVTME